MSTPASPAHKEIKEMHPNAEASQDTFMLDGNSLSPEALVDLGYNKNATVALSEAAWTRIDKARGVIDKIIADKETVYGINTGFGKFEHVRIPEDQLAELQVNLIRSHCAGVGEPLSINATRMLLALRINVLAKGFSGIRRETVETMLAALNKNCLSVVPCQGTVGASGDLAPLSHLALGNMGEGQMWDPRDGQQHDAADVLKAHGIKPITLQAKEGLALINGTQMIASIGAESVVRARQAALQADVVAMMTVEALQGTCAPYHPAIHQVRSHGGQQKVAQRLCKLLNANNAPSEITTGHVGCVRVQDAYSMRCIPQVHGVVHDTIDFVRSVLCTELNSATDNPMVFAEIQPRKRFKRHHDSKMSEEQMDHAGVIMSGGNFHGEYPAKMLDYLAIGVHELASISERRLERLCNPALSGLPAFLVTEGGLNSGFMIAHCTSAALVCENKVLTTPASVHSLSTSAAQEDHVSMGGFAARKCLDVVGNVEKAIAIELLAACQGIEFHRPKKTTPALEAVHKLVRSVAKPWDKDRQMSPDIDAVTKLVRSNQIWNAVKPFMREATPNVDSSIVQINIPPFDELK